MSALKISCSFSTTKVTHWSLLNLSCRNIMSRVIFYSIIAFYLQYYRNATLAKAGMSSTVNWIPTTCNRIAHVQNNLQHFTQSPALPSSNCREKTHWTRHHLPRKKKNIYSLLFCVTIEVKLSMFQYKIVHDILYTKNISSQSKQKLRSKRRSKIIKIYANYSNHHHGHDFLCFNLMNY